jgi:hypothetical protein
VNFTALTGGKGVCAADKTARSRPAAASDFLQKIPHPRFSPVADFFIHIYPQS